MTDDDRHAIDGDAGADVVMVELAKSSESARAGPRPSPRRPATTKARRVPFVYSGMAVRSGKIFRIVSRSPSSGDV